MKFSANFKIITLTLIFIKYLLWTTTYRTNFIIVKASALTTCVHPWAYTFKSTYTNGFEISSLDGDEIE